MRFTTESIGNYIETVKSFTRVSGQTINEEKTKLIFSLTPKEDEIEDLEGKGLLRENFYYPGQEVSTLGFKFIVGANLRGTDWIEDRIRPWEIVSKSYNDRKTLTNTLLISKLNYSLPFLFGLEEANFKRIQGVIYNFILKKLTLEKGNSAVRRGGD